MEKKLPAWAGPAFWGAIGGAVVLAIVAFSAGWVVTSGAAEEMAQTQTEEAVIAALTPVCVAQFKNQSVTVRQTKLAALEKEDSWERGDYVENQGWATLPGSEEPNDEVAETCATELMKLAESS